MLARWSLDACVWHSHDNRRHHGLIYAPRLIRFYFCQVWFDHITMRANMQILFTETTWFITISIIDLFLSCLSTFLTCMYHLFPSQPLLSPLTIFSNDPPCLPSISPTSLPLLSPLFPLSFLILTLASLTSAVFAGAGVWSKGGDNRWWLRSWGAKCDHHEPPHSPGLDVPLVLSAQVQLPSSGEDLSQGCLEGCAWLWWVYSGSTFLSTANRSVIPALLSLFLIH